MRIIFMGSPDFAVPTLQALVDAGEWNKQPPGPDLPDDVVANTLARYLEAFERLTGRPLIN